MRTRISVISVTIFIVLSVCHADKAQAQFWKNWFKKEEPPRRRPVPEKKRVEAPPPQPRAEAPRRRKREFDYPNSEKKARYRIDVLAPLYLDELVKDGKPTYKGRVPEKASIGVDFCQGIQLAADTLNKLNFQVDVYVHDVTNPQESPEALIRNKILDKSDLIIAALQSGQIPPVAQFAKKHEVNFISAVSPSDAGVTNNPYFTLLQPTLETHCGVIMKRVQKEYKNEQLVIYRRSSVPLDESAYNFLADNEDGRNKDIIKVLCNKLPERADLAEIFTAKGTNVIVMAVMDNGYAEVLLKQLHDFFPDYKFEVYGMPAWRGLPSLKKADAYPNVAVHITAPVYYDLTTQQGRYLSEVCSKNFNSKPNETVCRGYETLFWYANLLRKYGTIFNKDISDNGSVPFTRYDIKLQWDTNGEILYNENEHVYWYRYQEASFMVE